MLDYSSNVGRLRLRVADISDLPYLPDVVYEQVLSDNDDNLPRSAITVATYILGMLAHKNHRKLAQIEVWSDSYKQYRDFLLLTVTNPAFMSSAPIPYGASGTDLHPLLQFQNDWNKNYYNGTQSQQLAHDASISPNDGSLYGVLGDGSGTSWVLS